MRTILLIALILQVSVAIAGDKVYTDDDLQKYKSNPSSTSSKESDTERIVDEAKKLLADDGCGRYITLMKECKTLACLSYLQKEYDDCKHPPVKVRITR